jgi:hypothetical protein
MRIVNYSNFINEAVNHDALAQSVEDCLVELRDAGFEVKVAKVRNNFSGICLFITVQKSDDINGFSQSVKIGDIKESIDFLIDLLDDGYTYNVTTKVRRKHYSGYTDVQDYSGFNYFRNINEKVDAIGLEITNIKGKNNIVRSYESVEYSEDKILQEVDELLVELKDSKFDVYSNYIVKDGKNILELWVEKEEPDFDEGEYHNQYEEWFEEGANRFIIGDVYEPLALLTDWMKEKYEAELVDDGMNSDTFELKGGEFQMRDSEVFDPEWKELQKKYYGENYLKKKVAALFVKYVW